MEEAGERREIAEPHERPAVGNSRISRQYRGCYEYDTAAGHRARTLLLHPLVLVTTPALQFGRQPPPSLAFLAASARMVVRDPRLTRARPLFSTRRSFVDAVLFVIPFVIPLPLFVARRHAPRCLTLSLSDRESRPIKPEGSFDARARARAIETTDAPIIARYERIRSPDDRCVSEKNARAEHECRGFVLTRFVAPSREDIVSRLCSLFAANCARCNSVVMDPIERKRLVLLLACAKFR